MSPSSEAETAPLFPTRQIAGQFLGEVLSPYRGTRPIVLGIPRGGVPIAAEVARLLDGELDVIVACKLGVPAQPELAMGALTADGGIYIDDRTIARHRVTAAQLAEVITRELTEAQAREHRFRTDCPPRQIAGRTAIVVDDGLAMGSTMRAALRALRRQQPARLVAAVPVGSGDTCSDLRHDADDVVCVHAPESFSAVGEFYEDFRAVDDETVQQILHDFGPLEVPVPPDVPDAESR